MVELILLCLYQISTAYLVDLKTMILRKFNKQTISLEIVFLFPS